MKDDLPVIANRELATLEGRTGLIKVGKTLYAIHPEKFKEIDAITIYDSADKTSNLVCSLQEVKELKSHLEWFFERGGFNLLCFRMNNPSKSSNVVAMIRNYEDLCDYMKVFEEEISAGRIPIKYFISKTINVDASAKTGGMF